MTLLRKILFFFSIVFLLIISCPSLGQQIDTTSADGLFQAARKAAFDSSDYSRAKAYLFKALQKSPDYADVRIFLGRIYTWTKNYDSGRMAFKQVLALHPDYEEAVIPYIDLEYFSGNFKNALEVCQKGLQANPTSEDLMLLEAKILKAQNRFEEADRAINKLLLLNPKNIDAISFLKNVNETKNSKTGNTNPGPLKKSSIDTITSDGLFQAARKAAFDSSDYSRAKAYLFKALQKSPDYADVRIFLGRIYTWTKNYDSGRMAFKQVLALHPDYEDALLAYTDLEYFSDNYEKALEINRIALRNNPASEVLMLREAKILNAMKQYDAADRALEKVLLLKPGNADAIAMANSFKVRNKHAGNPPEEIDTITADGLLVAARRAAFDKKDYEKAKQHLRNALKTSPGYADIKIFLGRLHTWTDNKDSARYYFRDVLKTNPGYEDASLAYADLEYWNDNNTRALGIIDSALIYHPASADLLVRKAKILSSMRKYREANAIVQQALKIDKNNSDARSLAERIKELSTKNKVSLSYDYVYFDKQFSDPWHLASFDYTRATGIGSVTGRINYANRFKEDGVQYELEAYPRISKTFYSYVSVGYSDKVGVFPQWRGGFSLYINLPKSYEADLGIRYLKFSGDPTWIYTGYLGKYYKSWLFGLRTYVTPGTFTSTVSASYTASARYYFGGADDLLGINVGYGISPDDRFNSIQLDSKVRLVSYKTGLSFKKKISKYNVIGADATWFNQEYLPQTKGNQYQFSLSWLHRF